MPEVTLERATEVKSRLEKDLLSRPGVNGIDVGYRMADGQPTTEVVIRVYVQHRDQAPDIPAQVEGIPVVVIERHFELH
jgi:hypothetical protein